MTLKQARLLKAIPHSKTLREAGRKAGFTSLDIYRKRIKTHIANELRCEPNSIKQHYEALYKLCLTDNDKATAKGILDSLCRIQAMFKDKHEVNVIQSLPPEKITPELIAEAQKALEAIS